MFVAIGVCARARVCVSSSTPDCDVHTCHDSLIHLYLSGVSWALSIVSAVGHSWLGNDFVPPSPGNMATMGSPVVAAGLALSPLTDASPVPANVAPRSADNSPIISSDLVIFVPVCCCA